MPTVMVRNRQDRDTKVTISVNGEKVVFEREIAVQLTKDLLDALLVSHEAPFVQVIEDEEDD